MSEDPAERQIARLQAEVERLRAQYTAQLGVTEVWQRETLAERARAERAEARLAISERDRAVLEDRLREVDKALRESSLVLFQPTGGKLCVLRLKTAAQPEDPASYSSMTYWRENCLNERARLREVRGHVSDARLVFRTEPEDALKYLDKALAAAQPEQRFAPGYNVSDHGPTCDILTTRDGWEAECTCGSVISEGKNGRENRDRR